MLSFKPKTISDFEKIIEAASDLNPDLSLVFNPDGMSIRVMDQSQASMLSTVIPRSSFSIYEIAEPTRIDIDGIKLTEVLKLNKDEETTFELMENKLSVSFSGTKRKRTFKLPLITITSIPSEPKQLEDWFVVKRDSKELQNFMKDIHLFSPTVVFEIKPNTFIMRGEDKENESKVETEDASITKEATVCFQMKLLNPIINHCKGMIKMHIATNKPMKTEFQIGETTIAYYLAPKIED